jgi:hypothetical protein
MSFDERFALWSLERREQKEAAARVLRLVEEDGPEVVRVAFPDQQGLLRGKTLTAGETAEAFRTGECFEMFWDQKSEIRNQKSEIRRDRKSGSGRKNQPAGF